MSKSVTIIGTYLSPYVRKVLVVLDIKKIPYQIDPIIPFFGNDDFSKLSPLRKIPVLIDGDTVVNDSSIICQYLEDKYPQPSIYPKDITQRAKARWLEEYADSHMGEVFIWRLFNNITIKRFVWGEGGDETVINKAKNEDIPHILDFLEKTMNTDGFLFGDLSIADISIAAFFRNLTFARYQFDTTKWPKTAAFVERILKLESFEKLKPFEEKCCRTNLKDHRKALLEIGAPLTKESYGTAVPLRGLY